MFFFSINFSLVVSLEKLQVLAQTVQSVICLPLFVVHIHAILFSCRKPLTENVYLYDTKRHIAGRVLHLSKGWMIISAGRWSRRENKAVLLLFFSRKSLFSRNVIWLVVFKMERDMLSFWLWLSRWITGPYFHYNRLNIFLKSPVSIPKQQWNEVQGF